ncbi:hypothetical protein GS610_20380 [Ruegeria sp. HKCCD6228]|uniref:Uncharacterized protein n=1 Tax=Ruegeria atlantica TaxID=81569 RepID=A0ABX1WF10_9RHOB|nr:MULTISPECIES: hypothetical protein [Ruegeria]NOC94284.1 hypothetical protein [Ruegeria sp. HKCCD6604]NOD31885.1 hypothetical protein [Ruegeria atlantica]NOD99573.1 hypothetical protein [Ruegeria sp. HKCCD6228]
MQKSQGVKEKMQVAIHAGVAFSDEGLVMSSLGANRSVLAKYRTAVLGPRRSRLFVKVMSDSILQGVSDADARNRLSELVAGNQNLDRVVVSSDKFFGPRRTALQDGQIYPFAGNRTAHTDTLLDGVQVQVFAGLVNPGVFIPKILASIHEDHRRDILASTDLSCLSWLGMIEDLRDLAPQVQLTLWEHENSPLIWGDIIRAIAGLPDEAVLHEEFAFLSSLLTEAGQRHVLDIVRKGDAIDHGRRREEMANILDEYARPEQIEEELDLPGWNSDIVEAFTELYEQDLATIRSMPDVHVLQI